MGLIFFNMLNFDRNALDFPGNALNFPRIVHAELSAVCWCYFFTTEQISFNFFGRRQEHLIRGLWGASDTGIRGASDTRPVGRI